MITPEYRKQIRSYFYHYKNLLSIPKYWRVSITVNEKIKEYANVQYDYQEKKFDIEINSKRNQNLQILKDSILHELIHILFTPATTRLDLLLHKLECNEKVNFKRSKKNLLKYEEYLVARFSQILINQEKSINDKKPTA
jgi:hypothetical protein